MGFHKVAIVTDSAASVPYSLQAKFRIAVVPLHLQIGHEIFTEGVNISPPRVINALIEGHHVRTFEAPIAELSRSYRAAAEAGAEEIVAVHISGKLTGMVRHAQEAAKTSPIPVTVIDSGTMSLAHALVVLAAASVAAFGESAETVADAARKTMAASKMLFTTESLDYVHRSGEIPGIIRLLGSAFDIHPILAVVDGKVKLIEREREVASSRRKVHDLMHEYILGLTRPAVAYSLIGASATEAGLAVESDGYSFEASAGATMTAHSGPGTYLVAAADMPPEFMLTI